MTDPLILAVLALVGYVLVFITVFVAVIIAFLLAAVLVVKAVRRQMQNLSDANSD